MTFKAYIRLSGDQDVGYQAIRISDNFMRYRRQPDILVP